MDKAQLKAAIRKLEDNHRLGTDIRELLELGPGGEHARHGAIKRATDELGYVIENERARKLIEFSKQYSQDDLEKLVDDCKKSGYAPEFGVIIRLLPLKVGERNRLQRKAIKARWTKVRLNQEIARKKPADKLVDKSGKGRPPGAIKSLDRLTGEALLDARKWGRILHFLKKDKDDDDSVWSKLSKSQRKELGVIAKALLRLSQDPG